MFFVLFKIINKKKKLSWLTWWRMRFFLIYIYFYSIYWWHVLSVHVRNEKKIVSCYLFELSQKKKLPLCPFLCSSSLFLFFKFFVLIIWLHFCRFQIFVFCLFIKKFLFLLSLCLCFFFKSLLSMVVPWTIFTYAMFEFRRAPRVN